MNNSLIFMSILALVSSLKTYPKETNKKYSLHAHVVNDLDFDRYARGVLGLQVNYQSSRVKRQSLSEDANFNATEPINWVAQGFNTTARNQGQCDTAHVFAALGAIEALYFNKTTSLRRFSVQQFLDCFNITADKCAFGDPIDVYEYVKQNGIQNEASYPYEFISGLANTTCRANSTFLMTNISNYSNWTIEMMNSTRLQEELNNGPVVVGINADENFQSYVDGVYRTTNACIRNITNTSLPLINHYLLAVGYGSYFNTSSSENISYFLLKNSWGSTTWGMNGYIFIAEGVCNLGAYASRPVGIVDLFKPLARRHHNSATNLNKSILFLISILIILFI